MEREIASDLVKTPYVRLLALPGINVILAADLAGEMGPMHQYGDANAITVVQDSFRHAVKAIKRTLAARSFDNPIDVSALR